MEGLYWPGQNVNTLGDWDSNSGYYLKVSDETILPIVGKIPDQSTLGLTNGWSLIPVISECDVDAEQLFNGFDLIIVKEVAGWRTYWPGFGINTLGQLEPGKAYFVLMGSEGEINFPVCNGFKVGTSKNLTGFGNLLGLNSPWQLPKLTVSTHTIAISSNTINNSEIYTGDFIGAFDESGNCFGVGIWQGENTSITLFGNDPLTQEKDGFSENDFISLQAYNPETKEETDLVITWDQSLPQHNGTFSTNGLSAISELKLSATGIQFLNRNEVKIYPNPTTDKVFVKLPSATKTTISIFDMKGRLITRNQFTEMINEIDLSSYQKGIYIIEVKGETIIKTERLIKK